ncbi:MAG: class I SAM-dependent methyltransferase [Nitriliruptoraceae bacterium]
MSTEPIPLHAQGADAVRGDGEPSVADPERLALDPEDLGIKAKQAAYHDWESRSYEDKFAIAFDERCIGYARGRFRKVVPEGAGFGSMLEVGTGTGFFLINLALGGCLDGARLHATDISAGMLEVCAANGEAHGLDITTRQGDAEALPFDDESFDLVIGHAVLHHLPVPALALAEALRVLKPGGTLVIAGEPTELGDRLSWMVKRSVYRAVRATTAVPGLRSLRRPSVREAGGSEADAVLADLEHEVDLHTFRPQDVEKMAGLAGYEEVTVLTEELTANWFGWGVRTVEGQLRQGVLGPAWGRTAYRGYRALSWLDDELLERIVPRAAFYNLILHARKPYEPR